MFNIFISNQPTLLTNLVGDFAGDKALIANNHDPAIIFSYLPRSPPTPSELVQGVEYKNK